MLAFAAMMRGKSQTAIEAIDEMAGLMPPDWVRENAAIADGYIAMPLEVRLRFGRWDQVLAAPEPATSFPLARALRHHARGVALAAHDEVDAARSEQVLFRAARDLVPDTSVFGNNKAADLLEVADRYLDGEILYRSGREADAFATLREAVTLEDRLRYSEPPDWILPARHALGAALLRSGRAREAEAVYREDLDRLPNNGWSLFGLSRSLSLQGKSDEANSVRAQWEAMWREADFTLTSSCLCLPGK
jgi:tetratricopeptide (TPR) repeat protein